MDIHLNDVLQDCIETRILSILEESPSVNSSFLLAPLLHSRLKNNEVILFALHHHSIGHFYGVASKLGENLQALEGTGRLKLVDVMEKIGVASVNFLKTPDRLEILLDNVIQEVEDFIKAHISSEGMTLVLDHPGNIALAFNDWSLTLHYISCLQSLVLKSNCKLIYMTGPSGGHLSVLNSTIQHYSDATLFVRGLATGSAADLSGVLELKCKKYDRKSVRKQSDYHFQLQDKKVRLFAPGTVQLH